MCSIIGVGERLHKVLGQIDLGKLDSGERSFPLGNLYWFCHEMAHFWTDRSGQTVKTQKEQSDQGLHC